MDSKFYCSQKFWWLSVDLEKRQTLSCCAASPENIDITWLKENKNSIFNTPKLQEERKMMLKNIPVKSCENTCWKAEQENKISRRLSSNSNIVTHTNIKSSPETLHILIGSDCNMSCSYCCKQYSSGWYKDILMNGSYNVDSNDDRYILNTRDKLLSKISQKDILNHTTTDLLLDNLVKMVNESTLKKIVITGGEPFLYNNLENLINKLRDIKIIEIYSGLGINTDRFSKELNKIKQNKNIVIHISAENTNKYYEFNRYGNSWKRFIDNINCLKDAGIKFEFNCTISNLTVFGIKDFYNTFKDINMNYQACTDPDFLGINLLDDISKEQIKKNVALLNLKLKLIILNSIDVTYTRQQHNNLSMFINEYSRRRNLNLNIFPKTFCNFIKGYNE